MNPLFASFAAVLRDRGPRRRPGDPSLLRLLAGEVAWAGRQVLHPAKIGAAAVVAVGVGLVLGPTTPGPVLGAGWRLGLAVLLGFVALSLVHALLQRRPPGADLVDGRVDLGTIVRVVVAAVVVLLVGTFVTAYLLAAIVGAPDGPVASTLGASLDIDRPVLGGAALLLAGVLTAGLGHRLALPGSLLFLGLGMVVGSDGLGWVLLDDAHLVQSISVVALVVILFDGGLTTTPADLRVGLGPGLALATLGVAATAGVTALGAMVLLDVPSRAAWLIGAVVASTDASAVFALLRRVPLPKRLGAILQIESGANDPVAILLTVGLLAAWNVPPSASDWLAFGATQLVGGVLVGGLAGALGARALRTLRLGSAALYPVLAVAIAGLAYGSAAWVGASGFLAAYLAGIVLGAEAPRRRTAVRSFVGVLSSGVEVGLFLLLGLLVSPSELVSVAPTALGIVALLVFVARPLATFLSLAWFDFSRREVLAVGWLGMRGAVPIVLATLAFSAGIDEAAVVFDVVFFVVLASTLLQGTTAAGVLRRLRLPQDVGAADAADLIAAMPLDRVGLDVVEVALDGASPLLGRRLAAVPPPRDILVIAVVRRDQVIVPRGDTDLRAGDRLVVATPDQQDGIKRVRAWMRGDPAATRPTSGR